MIPTDPAKRLAPGLAARSPGRRPSPTPPKSAALPGGAYAAAVPPKRRRRRAFRHDDASGGEAPSAAYHLIFKEAMTRPTFQFGEL